MNLRTFRSIFAPVALCMLLVLLAAGRLSAVAQEATPAALSVLPPDASVAGQNLSQWHAQFWQWTFSLPSSVDPLTDDNGERCGFGQHGPATAGSPVSSAGSKTPSGPVIIR